MSVHRLPDGRWICRFIKGTIPGSPQKTKEYFGRGPDGEAAAKRRNAELGIGIRKQKISTPSFAELAGVYLVNKENSMRQSTYSSLAIKITRVIAPYLGEYQVHELSFNELDKYCSFRISQGVKNRTIRDDLTYIQAILNYAVERSLVVSNPVKGYKPPRDDTEKIRPPNKAEFEAILNHAAQHIQRAMWIAYFTGARPGPVELFSLQWSAVDFFRSMITITSAKKGGIELRELNLTEKFLLLLRQWWDEDCQTEKMTGRKPKYIIHYNGGQVRSIRKGWDAAKQRSGITRRIRRYDLRHMTATELLHAGVDIVTIAEILGNTVEQCSNAYLHVSNDRKKSALDRL